MTKTIKGVLVTPNQIGSMPRVYELEYNNYTDFYPLLDCNTFDIQSRKFNGEYYDIYLDDEGLLKSNNAPSIITRYNGKAVEVILGNVFIVKTDGEGNTISLDDNDIENVMASLSVTIYGNVIIQAEI